MGIICYQFSEKRKLEMYKVNQSGFHFFRVELLSGLAQGSPVDTVWGMAYGYRTTQALYVIAKLGVPDLLGHGPLTSDEIAWKLKVQSRPLFRIMRALAAQGVFTQDESDRFGLTPLSQVLRTDNPETLRYVAIAVGEESYRAAGEMLHTVKTGETAFNHVYGKGHWDYLAENPEASATFNKQMATSLARFPNPFANYDFKNRNLVVDVGGGQGHVLAPIIRSNPQLKGLLYDLPQGLTDSQSFLEKQGIANRCQVIPGSFFDHVPPNGDVYILSRILHDWADDKAIEILKNVRKAIREDGVLIIRENVIPAGDTPSMGKQLDLTMMFMLGGAERTEKEWKQLLEKTGFMLNKIIKTGAPFDLIEAQPK